MIIGSSYASPYGRSKAGISYVIFGKKSGFGDIDLADLSVSQGFAIYGASANDFSAHSLNSAGDINGDGYDDIIIGARGADPYGRADAGTSYVIFGKSSGFSNIDLANNLPISQGFAIYGAAINDWNGWAVSGIGDINGDGYDDIAVGSVFGDKYGRNDAGITYVIFGKSENFNNIDLAANLPISQGFAIYGAKSGDCNGHSLNSADFNSDGYSDLIIGAAHADPYNRDDAGIIYIIFGKGSGFANIDLANLIHGQGLAIFGATAGDLNGYLAGSKDLDFNNDGYDDISIGSFRASPYGKIEAGATYIIYGTSSAQVMNIDLASLSSTKGFRIAGAFAGDVVGLPAASFGDINGDGHVDLIVTSRGGENPHCYIIYGPVSTNIDLGGSLDINQVLTIYSDNPSSCFSAGDINKDGFTDIAIVDSTLDPNNRIDAGSAYIIFGSTDLTKSPTTQPSVICGGSSFTPILENVPRVKLESLKVINSQESSGIEFVRIELKVDNTPSTIVHDSTANKGIAAPINYKFNCLDFFSITAWEGDDLDNDGVVDSYQFVGTKNYNCKNFLSQPLLFLVVSLEGNGALYEVNYSIETVFQSEISVTNIPTTSPTILAKEPTPSTTIPKSEKTDDNHNNGIVVGVVVPVVSTVGGVILTVMSKLFYNKIAHGKYFIQNPPIGISLDNLKEINLVKYQESNVKFDYNNDGNPLKTSWVGANDAILVYDHNDNKRVDFVKEIVLTEWCTDAQTDFEALLCSFDSNNDKVFDKEDQEFSKFYLWQDKNQDGISQDDELKSLEEAGILSIDFNTQEEIQDELRELGALNKAEFLWADGRVTYAYDLIFTHDLI